MVPALQVRVYAGMAEAEKRGAIDMGPKIYKRYHPAPQWRQEHVTYVLLGRQVHMLNFVEWRWVRIAEHLTNPWALVKSMRDGSVIQPVCMREWWIALGVRGLVEIVEDRLGLRLWSRWTDRWRPPKWIRPWVEPLAPPLAPIRIEPGTETDCAREAEAFNRTNRARD